jgi:micrococcal nuclease
MKKRIVLVLIILIGAVVTHFVQAPVAPESKPEESIGELYPVTHIIDGDTIIVRMGGVDEKVRLLGIDTPEVDESRGPVECYGKEASEKTTSLLEGQSVYLETDPTQAKRDSYDRLLAYVYTSDSTLINKILVEGGYAREYTYDEPYLFQADFKAAEKSARTKEQGLWSGINCPE